MPNRRVLIAGLGPAGLALAAACGQRGLDVLAMDPHPDRPWRATYGMWEHEWRAALAAFPALERVETRITRGPALLAPRRDGATTEGSVPLPYVVVDPAGLQRALRSSCPSLVTADAAPDTAALCARRSSDDAADGAAAVVDCRGAVPAGSAAPRRPIPAQSAFGIVLADSAAERVLGGREGILMDWRVPDTSRGPHTPKGGDPVRRRTFLYAVRLPAGQTLLEETDLAGAPAMGSPELRDRLADRLGLDRGGLAEVARRGHGTVAAAGGADHHGIEVVRTEHVHFPLLAARRAGGIDRFGTAAGFGHPATGYSVATSLLAAGGAADALADGRALPNPVPRGTDILHRAGLRALLGISPDALADMFAAFGQLDGRRQKAFLTRTSGPGRTTAAMAAQWATAAAATRVEVAAAAVGARRAGS